MKGYRFRVGDQWFDDERLADRFALGVALSCPGQRVFVETFLGDALVLSVFITWHGSGVRGVASLALEGAGLG